jgi:hypothetical protein
MELPAGYPTRNFKSLGTKDTVRALDLRNPYCLHWIDHTLDLAWGERPALLPGRRPLTRRQLKAYRNHLSRTSPLVEARRYQAELSHASVQTKAEVARRSGVSSPRSAHLEGDIFEFRRRPELRGPVGIGT